MLRVSTLFRAAIASGSSLQSASQRLTRLLNEKKNFEEKNDANELKRILSADVVPVFHATAFDSELSSAQVRRELCLLCREAAFAAVLLNAKPNGNFVKQLLDFIRLDSERMGFVQHMTSIQVTKVIEYLTYLQVGDEDIFPILLTRLNFLNLHDVSRVMFSFSERGYAHLNVTALLPAYSGEKWSPRLANAGTNHSSTAEAVRMLRALSKSTRIFLERHDVTDRSSLDQTHSFPVTSFHLLRNNCVEFILCNSDDLRGAHWINFSRALMHFPPVVQPLEDFQSPSALQILRASAWKQRDPEVLTCSEVGEYAVMKVFEQARAARRKDGSTSSGLMEVREAFDCNPTDLLKLLRQLVVLPSTQENTSRLNDLVDALVSNAQTLSFSNTVKLFSVMRSMSSHPAVIEKVPMVAKVGGEKLLQRSARETLKREDFGSIVQFALLVYACRLRDVPELVEFIKRMVPVVSPRHLTAGRVVSLVNCLSVLKTSPSDREVTLQLIHKWIQKEASPVPLLTVCPEESVKLFRALVLQAITPSSAFLTGVFGSSGVQKRSIALEEAGAVAVFDLSRSFAYCARRARETSDVALEQDCWRVGIVGTVLPLLQEWTLQAAAQPGRAVEYVPLAWRCVTETLSLYLDVLLDHHAMPTLEERLREVYPFLKSILTAAATCVGGELKRIAGLSSHKREEALARIPFKDNSLIHFISALLSVEYYLYHASWQESQLIRHSSASNGNSGAARTIRDELVSDYTEQFLTQKINDISPMEILHTIFNDGAGGQQSTFGKPLLQREDTLEITTHLPFALSLVLNPGPVNEYFMEKSFPVMVMAEEGGSE